MMGDTPPISTMIESPAGPSAGEVPSYDPPNVVETLLASPQFQKSALFDDFLVSPSLSPCDDFNISPSLNDSPLTPNLDTPILNDLSDDFGMYGTEYTGVPLFSDSSLSMYQLLESPELVQEVLFKAYELPKLAPELTAAPIPVLPHTPDAVAPTSLEAPSTAALADNTTNGLASKTGKGRRSHANGTRKNVTPESLVPVDAPIQTRKYVTPSATSRKEIPAAFLKSQKRKRSRTQAFGDDEAQTPISSSPCPEAGNDEAEEQPPLNATEKELIEWKRRQNTLAARKSRKRKLEHQQFLETRVKDLETENEMLKVRSEALEAALRAHNIFLPVEI
ncbi:hypothetical protein J3R30DRAFT_1022505 [Lentinula aciculospora]|uniref:BZIP domain-containing protein n=1 Tax=Lentinula aciculospora TaxID=153920 RepID=A0A9W9A2C2_9AGAR|nr:hypothetical protein J3R30DRAFT_1022505 [Lentinula aciculospora]